MTSIGNITASGDGIDASVGGMTLTSTGNIAAGDFGIFAGGGELVTIVGDVSSQNRTGIHIEGDNPDVVINRGNGLNEVAGKTGGVFVKGFDGATVEITGIVTSASGNGIEVRADDRPLILNSLDGTVTANGAGIFRLCSNDGRHRCDEQHDRRLPS